MLLLLKGTCFLIETVRTVLASALATITSLEVILFGKHHESFVGIVKVSGFELGFFVEQGHQAAKLLDNLVKMNPEFPPFGFEQGNDPMNCGQQLFYCSAIPFQICCEVEAVSTCTITRVLPGRSIACLPEA